VTSETARQAGLEVAVEAERHDPDGLVEALLDDAQLGIDEVNTTEGDEDGQASTR
jgi:hypothetical protein